MALLPAPPLRATSLNFTIEFANLPLAFTFKKYQFTLFLAVMQQSVAHVQAMGLQGSTTACVLTVDQRTGQLHAANLGDSGFLVLGPAKDEDVGTGSDCLHLVVAACCSC